MTAIPPIPTYPLQIDTDRTLYKVYNTTETRLAENNNAWSDEIVIVPVSAEKPEIWANNGFGNIEGELFYYDAVDKDENDKVYKLKRNILFSVLVFVVFRLSLLAFVTQSIG